MRLLVVGGGGREHALAAALAADDPTHQLYLAPGNPGTASLGTNLNIAADDIERLVDAADAHAIDLIVVGPEVPLALGLADRLRAEGRSVFGPGMQGARIESSKAFAREVMAVAGVRAAPGRVFTDAPAALDYLDQVGAPIVVKASGLAAGKGAVVCRTLEDAQRAVRAMLVDRAFGAAGDEVVIEDFLDGEELSILAVTNGYEVRLLPAAQDHKRLLEHDAGPNTGGMGAYAPLSIATPELLRRVEDDVLLPTLAELARRGIAYRGVLYAGLMLGTDGSLRVIEFNCRFGDPEAQVILPLIESGLTRLLDAAARGEQLPAITLRQAAAVTTVLAAEGYPDAPTRGAVITIPATLPSNVTVYHAGTARRDDGALVTHGGRVLAVTAVDEDFARARAASSDTARNIAFAGKQFRRDIGWREAQRR